MSKRQPTVSKSHKVDLTKPIPPDLTGKHDCFGVLWDIAETACLSCADRDTCGIVFTGNLAKNAKEIEKELGVKFLDEADWTRVNDYRLRKFVKFGQTTTGQLIEHILFLARSSDRKAAVQKATEWIKGQEDVYTESGIVQQKEVENV